MASPTNTILTGLAVADLMVMIEYIPFTIHSSIEIYETPTEQYSYPWAIFTLFHAHFSVIFHSISTWLTVILAIWRYTSVSFPTESKRWCSMSNAKLTIGLTYIIVPIVCIPCYFTFEIVTHEDSTYAIDYSDVSKENNELLKKINFWVYSMGLKIVPCILLTHLSLALIRVLMEAERRKQRLKSNLTTGKDKLQGQSNELRYTGGSFKTQRCIVLSATSPVDGGASRTLESTSKKPEVILNIHEAEKRRLKLDREKRFCDEPVRVDKGGEDDEEEEDEEDEEEAEVNSNRPKPNEKTTSSSMSRGTHNKNKVTSGLSFFSSLSKKTASAVTTVTVPPSSSSSSSSSSTSSSPSATGAGGTGVRKLVPGEDERARGTVVSTPRCEQEEKEGEKATLTGEGKRRNDKSTNQSTGSDLVSPAITYTSNVEGESNNEKAMESSGSSQPQEEKESKVKIKNELTLASGRLSVPSSAVYGTNHASTSSSSRRESDGTTLVTGITSLSLPIASNTSTTLSRTSHQSRTSTSQSDRTTRMLLAILLLFLLTEFPSGVVTLLSGVMSEAFLINVYHPLGEVFDILALVNSAINFILYCVMSRLFRKTFCKIFWPQKYHKHYASADRVTRRTGDANFPATAISTLPPGQLDAIASTTANNNFTFLSSKHYSSQPSMPPHHSTQGVSLNAPSNHNNCRDDVYPIELNESVTRRSSSIPLTAAAVPMDLAEFPSNQSTML